MSLTKKFIYLAALGLLPLAAITDKGAGVAVFFVYNILILAAYLIDFFCTPRAKDIEITRTDYDKLYFKAENTIYFSVKNNSSYPLEVTLRDEIPDFHFRVISEKEMFGIVPAFCERLFSYKVLPTKRGSFLFPRVYINYKGILGLCVKYAKRPLEIEYKVYPNLKDLSKYRLLLVKSMALENGRRIINVRGDGQEFESLREYADGDDFRKINWAVSARNSKFVINQYDVERNQPVFMFIDTGRPMSYMLKGYKKLDYAINAALILSDIVNRRGDNSGLVVFGTRVDSYTSAGKGAAHRNNLMETLYHIGDTLASSDYGTAFRTFLTRQKRRSIVFIFTDFETEIELSDLASQVRILARNHVPVVVLMKNDSVIKMSNNAAKDTPAMYSRSVANEYLSERAKLIRTLNLIGVMCVESDSENFALDTVNSYLKIKASRG
ncbi:hypothetical protein AGMMS49975_03740 [Clostridia bacterium]|nr:hypothetical protein AGMMS49975_03740 [Clostridia bacterium]